MDITRETVRSSQNKYVSLTRGLTNKKNRENENLFRFDGVKLMCEAIKKGVDISFALVRENEWQTLLDKAEKLYEISENEINFDVIQVESALFDRLSEEMAPEGVICVARYEKELHRDVSAEEISAYKDSESILLLESVRDPQNVGAIVRVAAAFGVDRILMSRDCADIYNSKTLRASMGTLFAARIDRASDMPEAVKALREGGRRVFAAALERDSEKLGELEIKRGDCVVVGNEGHGLSSETIKECDGTVFIPMADGVESLNAATAAAVLVWEFFGSKKGGSGK